MKIKNTQKGFTLIELLVVISIIVIIGTVALIFLGDARKKGRDATITRSLTEARFQAEIYFGSNGSDYTDVCTTGIGDPRGILEFIDVASGLSNDVTCDSNSETWAIEALLEVSNKYFCVDNEGVAIITNESSDITSSSAECDGNSPG